MHSFVSSKQQVLVVTSNNELITAQQLINFSKKFFSFFSHCVHNVLSEQACRVCPVMSIFSQYCVGIRAEDIRRRSMLLRIPKLAVEAKKKKRRDATDTSCDYLKVGSVSIIYVFLT